MCLGRASCLGADAAGGRCLWKLSGKRCCCGEIENLEWKVITIEAKVYLVFILCIYPGSFPIFSIKIVDGFHGKLYQETLLMVTAYTRLPYTTELLEVMP